MRSLVVRSLVIGTALIAALLLLERTTATATRDARQRRVVNVMLQSGLDAHLAALATAPRYARPSLVATMPQGWAKRASIEPSQALPSHLARPILLDGRALWIDGETLWAQLGDGQLLRLAEIEGPSDAPTVASPLPWAVGLVLVAVLAWLWPDFARLRTLHAVAQAARDGHYEARTLDATPDAIGDISRQVDDMVATLRRHRKERDGFFRAVTHEMGTPLTRLAFALDLAESATTPTDRAARLKAAREQLDQLSRLASELVAFGFEAPDRPDDRRRIDVRVELGTLCEQNTTPDREVVLLFPDDVPPRLDVDPRGFRRAIDNLVRNAVRYATDTVRVSAQASAGTLEIWVEDDGPGIPQESRESIFEPFVTLDPSRRDSESGAGLGLTIVHRVVERHAGTVGITTSPHLGGAAFVTRWPLPAGIST
ncbi:MAG: ATP-binding protein [Myxococcota bacterium]